MNRADMGRSMLRPYKGEENRAGVKTRRYRGRAN